LEHKGDGRCHDLSWKMLFAILLICVCFEIAGYILVKRDEALKLEYGYKFSVDEYRVDNKLIKVIEYSFFTGFFTAFCGLSPTFFIDQLMNLLEISSPKTSLYLSMFACLTSSLLSLIEHQYHPDYLLYMFISLFFFSFSAKLCIEYATKRCQSLIMVCL
jgi:uncharacterized membrane protein YfcA